MTMSDVLLAVCEHGHPYAAIMLGHARTAGSLREWLDELDDDEMVVLGRPTLELCRHCVDGDDDEG